MTSSCQWMWTTLLIVTCATVTNTVGDVWDHDIRSEYLSVVCTWKRGKHAFKWSDHSFAGCWEKLWEQVFRCVREVSQTGAVEKLQKPDAGEEASLTCINVWWRTNFEPLRFELNWIYIWAVRREPSFCFHKTSLLFRLQAQTLPGTTPSLGKINPSVKCPKFLNHWWDYYALWDLEILDDRHSLFYD